jgi:membrane protein implicated in regulation of membrane protease activity
MKPLGRFGAVAVLLAASGYSLFVAVVALVAAKDYDPMIFWPSIAAVFLIAAATAWGAYRLYRRRSGHS